MKRASYRYGVAWLALNDEPLETDPKHIAGFVTTIMLADLFDVEPSKVAADVLKYRAKDTENHVRNP